MSAVVRPEIEAPPYVGQPVSRIDGPAKVTGAARYAAEFDVAHLAHAAMVASTIPKGRITAIDTTDAERADGVLKVLTHVNAPRLPYEPFQSDEDPPGRKLRVLQEADVLFNGQPVAVVVAETLAQARLAASLVRVTYEPADAATTFTRVEPRKPSEDSEEPSVTQRGAAVRALARAPVTVDATYVHAREHHNPMELHATIAAWDADGLTLYDKTQWVVNTRATIAHVFGIAEDRVRVVSPFVGGAFGSGLRSWPHVTIAALAAREVGRPVRVELSRREMYTSVGFRPRTEQRDALGARRDGRLTAIVHEAIGQTSAYEEYTENLLGPARMTYACPNVRTRYRLVTLDTNTPCAMRAPGVVSGTFALEVAMDELAVALGMDPLELRLANHADRDEEEGQRWSSKELRACYRAGARRFGWSRRTPEPRSMRDGGLLVGHGMATAVYPGYRSKATASATLFADGTALVRTASSDMGPGTYTSMTQVAADALQLPLEKVRFELGDTEMPEAPVHGGSITMASVGPAVQAACAKVRAQARAMGDLRRHGVGHVEATASGESDGESEDLSTYAFGAVFAEVRVDSDLGIIRVPRIIGAYDAGAIVNPKVARSQCIGGMVGGLGMALLEGAEWDARFGRVMNANIAEYLVPVNADVVALDALFVPSEDRAFNPLGAKGLAEIGICGVAPAIVNAIYHATGTRVRELPVRLESLL